MATRAAQIARVASWNRGAQLVRAGFIQEIHSHYLLLTVGGGDVRVPMVPSADYAVGEFAMVIADPRGWWVSGPLTVPDIPEEDVPSGVPSTPPQKKTPTRSKPKSQPKPPPPPKHRTTTLTANWTGTYRGGWRGDTRNLYQGDWTGRGRNTGAAFFGSKLTGLRADLSRSRSIRLRFKRLAGGVYAGVSVTWWTVSQGSRPSGAPNRLNSTGSAPSLTIGRTGEFTLPSTLRDQLLDGTARGLAIHVNSNSPYAQVQGSSIRLIVNYAPRP